MSQPNRAPEAETVDSDALYRAQVRYLFEKSQFYREKLGQAGFADHDSVRGISDIACLPFTEKDELRETRTEDNPVGTHLCVTLNDCARIYSTSGTTGTPSYIPLTRADLNAWITISNRSYGASGVNAGQKIVSPFNAGPFVAGATLDSFDALGLTMIPVGLGNTERLMKAVQLLKPENLSATPSYASYLAEWAQERGIDLKNSSVTRIMVAGEPGGGEPAIRAKIERAWAARVTEAMGIGDISISLWGECEAQDGMHFSGNGYVHYELIDPATGDPVPIADGAEGEMVYTHLRAEAAPLLRFRSRDHVRVKATPCTCGRDHVRIRCIGRTDDMLIVRGVNLFPTALREVVAAFRPRVSGVIAIRPAAEGVKQDPPLPVAVELAEGETADPDLAEAIKKRVRDTLMVSARIDLVPAGTLPRSDYKSKLVERSGATASEH